MSLEPGCQAEGVPAERTREIYRRHVVGGESTEQIARTLAERPEDVERAVASVDAWLAREFAQEIRTIRARHTERLETLFRRAIEGYSRSCEDETIHKRTAQGTGEASGAGASRSRSDQPKLKVETVTKGKPGDARFLAEARAALTDIRRMWGIDAGASARQSENEEVGVNVVLEAASDADLAVLREAHRALERLSGAAGVNLPAPEKKRAKPARKRRTK